MHDAELAPCDLMPRDGHFGDWDVQRLGEQQELDVEYPRREVLAREELAGGGTREQLKPALGVAQVAYARDAKHGVQAVHEEVAQDGPLRAFLGVRTHYCTRERAQAGTARRNKQRTLTTASVLTR